MSKDLRPDPSDESPHQPGADPWWSESYYFDAVSDDGQLGVFARLGHVPNQPNGLYSLAIVRRDGSVILLCAPSPAPTADGDRLTVTTKHYQATHQCVAALQTFRVDVRGTAKSFSTAADVLGESAGAPCSFALDLTWETAGLPYRWEAQDRYEIPCRVQGTVQVDGETVEFTGDGQRDHSWGPREWWSVEWVWSAFSLDDGARVHAVTVPAFDGYVVGYLQTDGELIDLSHGTSTVTLDDSDLPSSAQLVLDHDLTIDVTPLGIAPLRLVSPTGQVTHFVRAMARFQAGDGRAGHGWIEWNQLQNSPGDQS